MNAIKLSVYLSNDFRYVLAPDCFLPSNECAQLYGPMDACGQVTVTDALEIGDWNRVMAQIERHDYARIGPKVARHLLGRLTAGCSQPTAPRIWTRHPRLEWPEWPAGSGECPLTDTTMQARY